MGAVEPGIRDLAREANFAAFTVLLRSGQPMTHVMWVDADDDHVLINTEVHRAKYEAVRRDPRVTVTIWKRDDPYRFAEVRGRVVETVTGAGGAGAHRRALAEVPEPGLRRGEHRLGARDPPDRARPAAAPLSRERLRGRGARASGGRGATAAAP